MKKDKTAPAKIKPSKVLVGKKVSNVLHDGVRVKGGIESCGFSLNGEGTGMLYIGTNSLWFKRMGVLLKGKKRKAVFSFLCGAGETYSFTIS
jgi:hypothetical protein